MSKFIILKGYDRLWPQINHTLNHCMPVDDVVPGVGDIWAGWLVVEEIKEVSREEFLAFDKSRRKELREEVVDLRYEKRKAIELIRKADRIQISCNDEVITIYKD